MAHNPRCMNHLVCGGHVYTQDAHGDWDDVCFECDDDQGLPRRCGILHAGRFGGWPAIWAGALPVVLLPCGHGASVERARNYLFPPPLPGRPSSLAFGCPVLYEPDSPMFSAEAAAAFKEWKQSTSLDTRLRAWAYHYTLWHWELRQYQRDKALRREFCACVVCGNTEADDTMHWPPLYDWFRHYPHPAVVPEHAEAA